MGVQQILQTYSDNFNLDTILGRIMRELLWSIVRILSYIVDAISTVTDKLFALDSFYNNPNVINFINSFKPLIVALFAISFCIVGYELMFSQTKQFRKVAVNFLIAIAVILLLPMAMDKMNSLTNVGVSAVIGEPSNITNQIIKDNVVDLLLYDKENFNKDAIKQLTSDNGIDVKNILYINPTALIEPDFFNEMKLQNEDAFKKRLTVSVEGNLSTEDLNQGWATFWKDYYYRYSINFLNIIVALAVVGATLAFTCFKLGKLIFELGYNKLLAILVAPADINNGQRTKQVIQNILSIFIVVFFIAVLLKFYVLFVGMCANKKGMEYLVLMVSGSFVVIEGPSMIEKLFGIDVGLHSGFKTMMGAYLTGKAITGGASKLGNAAKSTASYAGMAAGSVIGGSAGMVSGITGNNKESNNNIYSDMKKENGDSGKGKSLYSYMNKKSNEDIGKSSSTGNKNNEPDGQNNDIGSRSGNTSSSYDKNKQTIGQHAKDKIRDKVQNNGIYKQTVKSYNLGKNTAQSIKNKNTNEGNK